ncbi:aldolase/citrate lyase family protein [Paraburkholderia jirisanensis]
MSSGTPLSMRAHSRLRSWLFTPATHPERFTKALRCGADVLIADLEDAVPPDRKALARDHVRALLDAPEDGLLPALAVRINTPLTRHGMDDLLMLLDAARAPRFILLPKIEAAQQVLHVNALLAEAGKSCALVPMIESARGMEAIEPIAQARANLAAVMFGAADYASDVNVQPQSLALQWARCRVAHAANAAGVPALDAPCFALDDSALLQADLNFAADNGFTAKAAIHPSHIQAINAAFTPSAQRIEWAQRVIEACDAGAGVVDGRMVDEAIAREARRVLAMQ